MTAEKGSLSITPYISNEEFLKCSPKEKHHFLADAYDYMRSNAQEAKPNFSVLICGSTIYGYNSHTNGNLDDLDGLIVTDRNLDFNHLYKTLYGICETDSLMDSENAEQNVSAFRNGEIDIVRVAGLYRDAIPFSFHCFPLDVFRSGFSTTAINRKHTNRFPNKPKYLKDQIQITLTGNALALPVIHGLSDIETLEVHEHFSRRLTDNGDIVVDILANKFLTSEVLWEKPDSSVSSTLLAYKRTFIRSALFFNPNATNDEIIDILCRSKRFSLEYRKSFHDLIENERKILLRRSK